MLLDEGLTLASARLKLINLCLQGLKAITLKLLYFQAKYSADEIAKKESKFDLRSIPNYLKRFIISDQDILDKRWNLCSGCEFLTKNNRCTKCGCFMQIKHRLSLSSCPIGKWDREYTGMLNVNRNTI